MALVASFLTSLFLPPHVLLYLCYLCIAGIKTGKLQSEAQLRAKQDGRNAATLVAALQAIFGDGDPNGPTPPELIFNMDITGMGMRAFMLKRSLVLYDKKSKLAATSAAHKKEKKSLTSFKSVGCANAAGRTMDPLFLMKIQPQKGRDKNEIIPVVMENFGSYGQTTTFLLTAGQLTGSAMQKKIFVDYVIPFIRKVTEEYNERIENVSE